MCFRKTKVCRKMRCYIQVKKVYIRCTDCGRILKGRATKEGFSSRDDWKIEFFPRHNRWISVPRDQRLQHLIKNKTKKPIKFLCWQDGTWEIVEDRK